MRLICPRYTVLRKKYLKKYYIVKTSMYKFVALLNAENNKEQQRLAAFTNLSFKNITNNFSYTCTFF